MEDQFKTPRAHTPEQELGNIKDSVEATMNAVYEGKKFNEAPEAVQEQVVKQAVDQHVEDQLAQTPIANPFGDKAVQKKAAGQVERLALHLSPDEDDAYIQELLEMVQEVGVLATIKAIDATANYHIKDDLHRALVAYLKAGYPAVKLPEKSPIAKGLSLTLFELYLPVEQQSEQATELGTLLASMEQFYAGMRGTFGEASGKSNYFSIEIALPQERDEVVIYAAVPQEAVHIFKNQLLAIFPNIKIVEANDDYNIFNKKENTAVSVLKQKKSPLLPIKTYKDFAYDPLNIILESFANLEHSEGAAIQIMVGPDTVDIPKQLERAIGEIEEGDEPREAMKLKKSGIFAGIGSELGKDLKLLFDTSSIEEREKEKQKKKERAAGSDRKELVEAMGEKQNAYVLSANIRLVTAGNSQAHAESLLAGFESAFYQFARAAGNEFEAVRQKGRNLQTAIKHYTFRIFDSAHPMYLNTTELTSLLHFHKKHEASSDMLSSSSATTSGASSKTVASSRGAPGQQSFVPGKVLLGNNIHQGSTTPIYLAAEDRLRHMYVVGQTGTGKTSILKNMIVQDIHNGEGCCFIDPHGSDIEDILGNVPPHRYDDVIYLDPADTERPIGINMLEYDERYPEQKSFVVNEMFAIFDKLFDMSVGGGAMFEQYFRNATQLVIDDPQTGSTLLEISRVLSDANFRRLKLARCNNMIVKQFWQQIAGQAGGEASLENIVPYITSKFDSFIGDDIMRPIIAQQHSSFNFRQAMDEKKIVLINLSKGRLGEKNANLLGLVIVGKILMAALSRVDAPRDKRPPFYLYIDEFQNVTTDSISQILSEARKYGLSLNVAHQYIKQLDEGIRNSVFGNVGNMATFRVSTEDAEFLEKVHAPVFTAQDIANVDNFNAYVKMLVAGQPQRSFSLETLPPEEGSAETQATLKELSRQKYGRPRAQVEAEIARKYQAMSE